MPESAPKKPKSKLVWHQSMGFLVLSQTKIGKNAKTKSPGRRQSLPSSSSVVACCYLPRPSPYHVICRPPRPVLHMSLASWLPRRLHRFARRRWWLRLAVLNLSSPTNTSFLSAMPCQASDRPIFFEFCRWPSKILNGIRLSRVENNRG